MTDAKVVSDRPSAQPFSRYPGLSYFLAITIPVALFWLLQLYEIYYCVHTTAGLDSSFCRYHDEMDRATAGHHSASRAAVFVATPFLVLVFAAIYAPLFLCALSVERYINIERNVVGVAYWMIAWVLIGVSPVMASAIVAFIQEVLQSYRYAFAIPGSQTLLRLMNERTGWAIALGVHGAISGLIYSILSLARRNRPWHG